MLRSIRLATISYILAAVSSTVALSQTLPGTKRDLDFDALMKTVDLDDPSIRLEYKRPTSDGSSIGVFIGKGEQPTDASFVPANTSSIPEAEVVSYRLARFLGVSRTYYPVDYYKLGPKAYAKFRDMVLNTREIEDDRIANRNLVMKELKASPDTLLGIYRIKPKTKMYTVHGLGSEGQFNLFAPLAKAIRASGPMPGDRNLTLDGIKGGKPDYPSLPAEREVELARQLSTIFVIDQLIGQWDRFWENLEASGDKTGRLKLIARDNGGATLDDWDDYEAYNRWVSRYDRELIGRLTALNAFLKGETKDFAGFTSPGAWKDAAGFIVPSSFDTFHAKLARLIEKRIPALEDSDGDEVYFPPKAPETAKLDDADTGEDD
jgi:hypothetical protein